MSKSQDGRPLAMTDEFQKWVGFFHGAWASIELTTDYAIWKFLKVTPGQAHLITSGMMFGRKARLLADLIGRSDHHNKDAILGAFNKLRGGNKRDVFAHSYLRGNDDEVTYLERSTSGEYRAVEHKFTLVSFKTHVADVTRNGLDFHKALGATREDVNYFAKAASSLDRKSNKSPGKPTSKS